jgi:hypothetical protein
MDISNFPAFAILGCSDFTLFVMVDFIISQQIYYNIGNGTQTAESNRPVCPKGFLVYGLSLSKCKDIYLFFKKQVFIR